MTRRTDGVARTAWTTLAKGVCCVILQTPSLEIGARDQMNGGLRLELTDHLEHGVLV